MRTNTKSRKVWKKIFALLPQKQKLEFFLVLAILAVSAVLSQLTPLAVGYLTDHVLAAETTTFQSVLPILLVILAVNVVNEIIKVIRRLIVEDAATQAEKNARQRAALSLLMAPLSYFRGHMTGNIHGRLNRSLEGTVKLIKLLFMDFAPAVSTGLAAIVTIFWQLPFTVACLVILVIPVGTFIVFRQISTQKGIRVELMETKADMDGTMVELLGGIETIRALDSAQTESARIEGQSEQLRKKEMRHHKAMALYDCLKFVNEAFFSVLVIGISVLLASRQVITIGTVLTAYLCFTQLTGPLRELHRILDEFSECVVLADDYFRLLELPLDFSYEEVAGGTRPAGDDEAAGVQHLDGMLDLIELFVGAGAQYNIFGLSAIAAPSLQNGGAAVGHPVDLFTGCLAVTGDDQRKHRGREAKHHLVDDGGHNKIKHQTVDDGVHIPEHRAVEQNDRQRRTKSQIAERQMRVFCLDGHGDEVDTAGAGILHIDQGIPDSPDHTAADGGQQAVAGVDRHDREQIVGKNRKQDHTAQTAQKERSPQQFVAENHNRYIDKHIAQAHRQPEQAVQNGTNTRHTGYGDFRGYSKAVNACRRNEAAQHFQQQIDGLVLGHGFPPSADAANKKPGALHDAPGQVTLRRSF